MTAMMTRTARPLVLTGLATLLLAGCSSIPSGAYKETGGCRIDRYNPTWVAKNVTGMTWEGTCLKGLADGYGKLTVTRADGVPETYRGYMQRGTFSTLGRPTEPPSEFVSGKYRWVGLFSSGRFYSGQIYIDGKLDYDGSLHASGRYGTGKNYFASGTYIDGSYIDRAGGSVHHNGQGVFKGVVYSPENKPLRWIYQEKAYSSEKAWKQAIEDERVAAERKARNEAALNASLDSLFTKMDSQVTASTGDSEAMLAYYSQNRDVAQAKMATMDKLIAKCTSSSCDYLDLLRNRRNQAYQSYQSHDSNYDRTQESIASAARMQALLGVLEQVAVSSGYVDGARYQQAKAQQQQLSNALSRLTSSGSSVESAGNLAEIYLLMQRD